MAVKVPNDSLFSVVLTRIVRFIRKFLILFTMFSFPVLFVLVFYFLFTARPLYSAACALSVVSFCYLNKNL